MEEEKKDLSKFSCPVCKLRYNKDSRQPIFMLCCQKTTCKTCVLSKMSTFTGVGNIKWASKITGSFKCSICQATKYSPKGSDSDFSLQVNEFVQEMLDDISEILPVTSDNYPNNFVTWYNKSTKKIHSDDEHAEFP